MTLLSPSASPIRQTLGSLSIKFLRFPKKNNKKWSTIHGKPDQTLFTLSTTNLLCTIKRNIIINHLRVRMMKVMNEKIKSKKCFRNSPFSLFKLFLFWVRTYCSAKKLSVLANSHLNIAFPLFIYFLSPEKLPFSIHYKQSKYFLDSNFVNADISSRLG
jgi:hypothetical protein